jgi:rod shape-determining protein MreC
MLRASDRTFSRRDTVSFLVCLGLSLLGLFLPSAWGESVAASLRDSALTPFVWLQARAAEGRTSRARFRAVTAERDSAAIAAQFLPAISAENRQLRALIGLRARLETPYVPGEVLHQSAPTDARMLLIRIPEAVSPFEPVISADGLIGVVWNAGTGQASVMTWAHPEFRVSAFSADGRVFGMVAPSTGSTGPDAGLEFRSTSYRDTVPAGTAILSSGLGGVYPKGIPLGTVLGIAREQAGWERVYRLRPAANPSAVTHVLVLRSPHAATVATAFPGDSMLAALRADSARRLRLADSLLRIHIADSILRILGRDTIRAAPAPAKSAPATSPPPKPTPARPAAPDSAR